MCPDKELLSAYRDNELDVRSSRRIRAHLDECSHCTWELAGLSALSEALESNSRADEQAEEAARIRVWQGIMRRRDSRRYMPLFMRNLRMPLPALVFMAVLSMALGAAAVAYLTEGGSAIAEADMPSIPEEINVNNVEELLSHLRKSESQVNITIQLPDEPLFIVVGEPQLLRAAEYRQGK
jgi:anti-sigma factor RsiW